MQELFDSAAIATQSRDDQGNKSVFKINKEVGKTIGFT